MAAICIELTQHHQRVVSTYLWSFLLYCSQEFKCLYLRTRLNCSRKLFSGCKSYRRRFRVELSIARGVFTDRRTLGFWFCAQRTKLHFFRGVLLFDITPQEHRSSTEETIDADIAQIDLRPDALFPSYGFISP